MNKKLLKVLLACSFQLYAVALDNQLDAVLQDYTKALQDLVQAHQVLTPDRVINFKDSTLIGSTYQKIIAPSVAYCMGFARVVQAEYVAGYDYHKDLTALSRAFKESEAQAQKVSGIFSTTVQSQAMMVFYNELEFVVQLSYNLIQDMANRLAIDPMHLASCYQAYTILVRGYTKDMNIKGVPAGSDCLTSAANLMISLYQAAIVQRQNELTVGMTRSHATSDVYKELEAYYTILARVYTQQSNGAQASVMTNQAQSVAQQAQNYVVAQTQYQQALQLLQNNRIIIPLQVRSVGTVQSSVNSTEQYIIQAYNQLQQAQANFQAASDTVGSQMCAGQRQIVQSVDFMVRSLGQMWLLYLQDQSAQNVMTAPTLSLFLSQQSNGPITIFDVERALRNLSDFITQTGSSVAQLANQQLSQFSIVSLSKLLSENFLNTITSGANVNPLVSYTEIQSMQTIILYIELLAHSLADSMFNASEDSVAKAMSYAQELDGLYPATSSPMLQSLVPYFPAQITATTSWKQWAATLLLKAKIVSSLQEAYKKVGTVQILQPKSSFGNVAQLQQDAQAKSKEAQAMLLKGKFQTASSLYEQAYESYKQLYADQTQAAQLQTTYQALATTKTAMTASSFAGTIKPYESFTWDGIAGIPKKYKAAKYQFGAFNMAWFSNNEPILPNSLLSLSKGVSQTTLTENQRKDLLMLLKSSVAYQLLQGEAIEFTDCFNDYSMTVVLGLPAPLLPYVRQVQEKVQAVFEGVKLSDIVSVVRADDETTISSVVCKNIMLPAVTPVVSTMATAANFLESAYTLFMPSTNQITIAGTEYAPVNNQQVATIVCDRLVKTYLSEAYGHVLHARTLMASMNNVLLNKNKAIAQTIPSDFTSVFNQVNQHMTRAQALLYAPDQSAYAYSVQGSFTKQSQNIQKIFFGLYQEMIDWMKKCLVGDPFSSNYQMLLHAINQSYINWASELDPVQNAAQIVSFNQDVALLFKNAADACMQAHYVQTLFPGYKQFHYFVAARYYLAAYHTYTLLQQTALAQDMLQNVYVAYYNGSLQNLGLYFYAQKNGVVYQSAQTGQSVTVSTAQMMQDDQVGFIDLGEQDAYSTVKNLLLNAAMGFEFLSEQKPAVQVKAKQPDTGQVPQPILKFLQEKNLIGNHVQEIPYYQKNMMQDLISLALIAYNQFKTDTVVLAAWMNIFLLAVQAQYAQDYLGAQGEQAGPELQQQMQLFFEALQKEASSLSNPSSAYIG